MVSFLYNLILQSNCWSLDALLNVKHVFSFHYADTRPEIGSMQSSLDCLSREPSVMLSSIPLIQTCRRKPTIPNWGQNPSFLECTLCSLEQTLFDHCSLTKQESKARVMQAAWRWQRQFDKFVPSLVLLVISQFICYNCGTMQEPGFPTLWDLLTGNSNTNSHPFSCNTLFTYVRDWVISLIRATILEFRKLKNIKDVQ